jgi:TetR/AcrR family transcriptional regulator, repressor of fatR-cypB operon
MTISKKQPHKENNIRDKLSEAALNEFSDVEFDEATMRNIAKRAGVSVATLYKYYESKEALANSLAMQITEDFDKGLELHLSGIAGTADKIRKMVWYYLHFFETNEKGAWLLFVTTGHSVYYQAMAPVHPATNAEARSFEQLLRIGQERGEVREDLDVRMARSIFYGSLHEIIVRWVNRRKAGKNNELLQVFDPFCDIFITAIQSKQSSFLAPEQKALPQVTGSQSI